MPTAVQPTNEKLLPPSPKASSQKGPAGAFEVELNKARPAPRPEAEKPAVKKATRAAKPKHGAKKAAKHESCEKADVEESTETDSQATDAVAEVSDDAGGAGKKPASKEDNFAEGKKVDAAEQSQISHAAQTVNPAANVKNAENKGTAAPANGNSKVSGVNNGKSPAVLGKVNKGKADASAKTDGEDASAQQIDPDDSADEDADSDADQNPTISGTKQANSAAKSAGRPATPELGAALQQQPASDAQAAQQAASGQIQLPQNIADAVDAIEALSDAAPDPALPVDPTHQTALHVTPDASEAIDPSPHPAAAPLASVPHAQVVEARPAPPEVQFAEANHPQIVTGIHGQLLPDGGTMHIRLDPPELGALQVSVHMRDGVMTASFQTTNDDATRMLSHSLAQLKHVLESQGVSVDKLHVTQAPRDQQAGNEDRSQQNASDNPAAKQEQQRRELIQRMWRRIRNGSDPLDMVA